MILKQIRLKIAVVISYSGMDYRPFQIALDRVVKDLTEWKKLTL